MKESYTGIGGKLTGSHMYLNEIPKDKIKDVIEMYFIIRKSENFPKI
jgi:hypothetical protein